MTTKRPKRSRYTVAPTESTNRLESPFKGYEDAPLLPLIEAINLVSHLFDEIKDYINAALKNCQNPLDGLTEDESAAVHLYTMQLYTGHSLYQILNRSLRAENREELIPWFPYLKLFFTALEKLPSLRKNVRRGVRGINFSSKYTKGMKFHWWSVNSCTTDLQLLNSKKFLGTCGPRTLFAIECINGKSISNHSHFPQEGEVILMPGTYFEVVSILNDAGGDLCIIDLKEISLATPIPPPLPVIEISNTELDIPNNQPKFFRKFMGSFKAIINPSNPINMNSSYSSMNEIFVNSLF